MTPTPEKKIFAIGDIHGQSKRLGRLLERLPLSVGEDTIVFLGDYINRGEDTKGVIGRIIELKTTTQVICLMGNHEKTLLDYVNSLDPHLLPYLREMGIETTLASYHREDIHSLRNLELMPQSHREFIENLTLFWETDDYLFVHAGLDPSTPIDQQSSNDLTEARSFYQTDSSQLSKTVIFGHTPFETPLVKDKLIGIDTDVIHNYLTAVELPGRVFHHA